MTSGTHLARLACDETTARRLAAVLSEALPDDPAIAAFEDENGRWTVEVTFGAAPDETLVRRLVEEETGTSATGQLQFSTIDQRDWVAASLEGLPMVRAGRFIVHGAHHRAAVPPNAIAIEIEAALAFGTGHHGTTRGCLLAIDRLGKRQRQTRDPHPARSARQPAPFRDRDKRVLDVGTGTGVLAIAAARMFRRKVHATDIDPVAIGVARANARHNRAAALVITRTADGRRALPWCGLFDLILANILLGPLTRMARPLSRRLAPGGRIVLSGLMPNQANAALAAYRSQGLLLERRENLENWVTLTMRRGRVAGVKRRP
jgi:ribosomal protein L11 methyltransferase